MALDQITAKRLVKLLGMTGSTFDGEALTAVRKANELLRGTNQTWEDVITAKPAPTAEATARPHTRSTARPPPGPRPRSRWREPEDWRDAVEICMNLDGAPLSDWDRGFLTSLSRRYSSLTQKQQDCLDRIVDRCRRWSSRRAA